MCLDFVVITFISFLWYFNFLSEINKWTIILCNPLILLLSSGCCSYIHKFCSSTKDLICLFFPKLWPDNFGSFSIQLSQSIPQMKKNWLMPRTTQSYKEHLVVAFHDRSSKLFCERENKVFLERNYGLKSTYIEGFWKSWLWTWKCLFLEMLHILLISIDQNCMDFSELCGILWVWSNCVIPLHPHTLSEGLWLTQCLKFESTCACNLVTWNMPVGK